MLRRASLKLRQAAAAQRRARRGCAAALAGAPARASSSSFEAAGLDARVAAALEAAGYEAPTAVQARAAEPLLARRHAVVAAETGSGKTLAYLAPVAHHVLRARDAGPPPPGAPAAVVLCPNALLCEQVVAAARALRVPGGPPLLSADTALPLAPGAAPDVLVATPARLLRDFLLYQRGDWRLYDFARCVEHVRHVVLDEADMLLDGGYLRDAQRCIELLDREEEGRTYGLGGGGGGGGDYDGWDDEPDEGRRRRAGVPLEAKHARRKFAHGARPPAPRRAPPGGVARQYVFAAATMPTFGKKTPGQLLRAAFPDAEWVSGDRLHRNVDTLEQRWCEVSTPQERYEAVAEAVRRGSDGRTLVFCESAGAAEDLAAELSGPEAIDGVATYHAEVRLDERAERLRRFAAMDGVRVLVCTDAASRGLHVDGVEHVVQADFARTAVDYIHRVGRTARAGAAGRVSSLYGAAQRELAEAVRAAAEAGTPVEKVFSRRRSFRRKLRKADAEAAAADDRL